MLTLFEQCLGLMLEHRDTIFRELQQAHDMPDLDNAQYWRDRAEEVVRAAEAMHDPDTKRMMLEMAASYERLAVRAEEGWTLGLTEPKKPESKD